MIRNRNLLIFAILIIMVLFGGITVCGADNPVIAKNIEFVNADLRDVFRSLAEAGRFNVVIEPTVHGDVTLSLKYGVTIKDAVSVIAKTYGYSCRWLADSPTVVIGSANFIKLNFDHKISKVYQLKYADPNTVAESLEVVIPKNRIKAETKNNQITVMASDSEIANITEIITALDRELPMIYIETKVEEVTGQFWKEIGVDNTFSSPHMGVYLLTGQQLKAINDNPRINILTKPNLSGLDNHEAKIFIGDKVPLITEKNKQGDINYKVEYVDTGNTLSITPRINSDNQLTILVKIAVSTIANKSQPGTAWVPWVVTREFETTIRLEAGQAFILSGLLQRSEYNMMKNSPYQFPVLTELFAKENPVLATPANSQTEVVILFTPKLLSNPENNKTENPLTSVEPESAKLQDQVKNDANSLDTGNVEQALPIEKNQTEQVVTVGSNDKLPIDEEKPAVTITASAQTGNEGNEKYGSLKLTDINYQVKKGDSLASIVKKFASVMQIVMEKNKLNGGTIKTGTILIIPVPSDHFYTLKPKETLWRIAKRYGTTLAVLKDLNGITDETKVKAGRILVLPVPVTKIAYPQF